MYKLKIIALLVIILVLITCANTASTQKFNMSYMYFGDPKNYIDLVNRTNGSLDEVAPNYFELSKNGSLLVEKIDPTFISAMHEKGIRVVPFLADGWNREKASAALANRDQLVNQIENALKCYDLDGVNVNIEHVSEVDRNDYNDLLRLLRERIPQNKVVAVAVAANPEGWVAGWQGAYDCKTLAVYSDYLMLMAYDENSQGDLEPGPVASISFVEESIQQVLAQGVPPDKIVLGIPFYGRLWDQEGDFLGEHIFINQVDEIVKANKGSISYDHVAQSPVAHFSISSKESGIEVEDKKLTRGNYTLWYENDDSIQEKLKLVGKYKLKGAGSWSLGQEDPSLWDQYSAWLNDPVK